jgi:hypothetical protein
MVLREHVGWNVPRKTEIHGPTAEEAMRAHLEESNPKERTIPRSWKIASFHMLGCDCKSSGVGPVACECSWTLVGPCAYFWLTTQDEAPAARAFAF